MASAREFGRFLKWSALVTATGALACVALVVVADPYRLYRVIERPGFNQLKTQPVRYQNEIKLAGVRAARANLFIVGNSRAEIGLDPAYPPLAATGLAPYNLALAGTRIELARHQLEQLERAGQRARHLIVGAEFLDFPIDPDAPQPPVQPPPTTGMLAELAWRFDTLFSLDALADAARTIGMQGDDADTPVMTAQGFNPLREYRTLARDEGYYALFQQRAADYAKRFAKAPRGLVNRASGSSKEFEQLRAVVEQGARAGARVDVVIYPYHAQLMALMEKAGMAPMFEQWKAMLAGQMETLQAAYPAARITLWDFSGYARYQCEAIPAKGDRRTQTRWYWEGGHFKAELGNVMLDRMLGLPGAEDEEVFGVPLRTSGLEQNRQRIAAERERCKLANGAWFRQELPAPRL
jgi:hypothetical protein